MLTGKGLGAQPGVGTCVNEVDRGSVGCAQCRGLALPQGDSSRPPFARAGDSSRWQVVMVGVVIIWGKATFFEDPTPPPSISRWEAFLWEGVC